MIIKETEAAGLSPNEQRTKAANAIRDKQPDISGIEALMIAENAQKKPPKL